MAIYHGNRFTVTGSADPESVLATSVGDGFFDIVGAKAALKIGRSTGDTGKAVLIGPGFPEQSAGGGIDGVDVGADIAKIHGETGRALAFDFAQADGVAHTRPCWK